MRRTLVSLSLALALAALWSAPASARLRITTEPLPLAQRHLIEHVCAFPVEYTDRGGRTLTTRYDRSGAIESQTITGISIVELRNLDTGSTEAFEIDEVVRIRYRDDGSATVAQVGSSGIAIDPGTSTRTPELIWYGGVVASRGTLDRAFLLSDVTRQTRAGIEGDICEMLVTGLKPRH